MESLTSFKGPKDFGGLEFEMEEMLGALSRLLVGWVRCGHLRRFGPLPHVREEHIEQLLRDLASELNYPLEVFIVGTKYLLRLHKHTAQDINLRFAILAALSLAHKFLQDDKPDTKLHAMVGGISAADLSRLESAFLESVSYRLFVTGKEYGKVLSVVEVECVKTMRSRADMGVWSCVDTSAFFQPLPNTTPSCTPQPRASVSFPVMQIGSPFGLSSLYGWSWMVQPTMEWQPMMGWPAQPVVYGAGWIIDQSSVDCSAWAGGFRM